MNRVVRSDLTRRGALALAAAGPVAAQAATRCTESRASWHQALGHYRAARHRHELYLAQVLDPVLRSVEASGLGLTPRIAVLETKGDALCSNRHDALAVLMDLPAPCLVSLKLKFQLAYEEYLKFDDDKGCFKALLADLERLARPGAA